MTTGELWQFLQLEAERLTIDSTRSYLDNRGHLPGAFVAIASSLPPLPAAP